jgi:hypothetical protein
MRISKKNMLRNFEITLDYKELKTKPVVPRNGAKSADAQRTGILSGVSSSVVLLR